MNTPELSIILPGIRTHNWIRLYDSIIESMGDMAFELIAIGPYDPPAELVTKENFKFIRDFGNPTRCAMIATQVAKAPLFIWSVDDGYYYPNALKNAINLWKELGNEKSAINLRYNEGRGLTGEAKPLDYWDAEHHAQLHIPGVKPGAKICLFGLMSTKYFREIGGFDGRYEYINMNGIDLGFRMQDDGGQIVLSPDVVMNLDWLPDPERVDEFGLPDPVIQAFYDHDYPLFLEQYSKLREYIKIDYNNWMDISPIWKRRKFNNISQYIHE